jgi:hypothetical protein
MPLGLVMRGKGVGLERKVTQGLILKSLCPLHGTRPTITSQAAITEEGDNNAEYPSKKCLQMITGHYY